MKNHDDNNWKVQAELVRLRTEITDLFIEIEDRMDAINPETANWGHVGDLTRIAELLRRAAGREE